MAKQKKPAAQQTKAAIINPASTSLEEVKIGKQIWMTKNLDVTCFKNGDPIREVKNDDDWEKAGENEEPAFCYFENKKNNSSAYGVLYNWYAVNDPRGLAPDGFHIPTSDEWNALIKQLGGKKIAGKKIKIQEHKGTNDVNFSGLVAGKRDFMGFSSNISNWWTSSLNLKGIDSAMSVSIGLDDEDIEISGNGKSTGNYVRCIKN